MAKTITIEITDSEYRCLEYITETPSDFVDNATTFRARAAKDEILPLLIAHCNEKSIALATGEAAQIEQAYSKVSGAIEFCESLIKEKGK